MSRLKQVIRVWTFWVRSECADHCRERMEAGGRLVDMRAAPGNLDVRHLFRDLGDGSTEVAVVSRWVDQASIDAYTNGLGDRPAITQDELWQFFDREPVVRHYEVDSTEGGIPKWY